MCRHTYTLVVGTKTRAVYVGQESRWPPGQAKSYVGLNCLQWTPFGGSKCFVNVQINTTQRQVPVEQPVMSKDTRWQSPESIHQYHLNSSTSGSATSPFPPPLPPLPPQVRVQAHPAYPRAKYLNPFWTACSFQRHAPDTWPFDVPPPPPTAEAPARAGRMRRSSQLVQLSAVAQTTLRARCLQGGRGRGGSRAQKPCACTPETSATAHALPAAIVPPVMVAHSSRCKWSANVNRGLFPEPPQTWQ